MSDSVTELESLLEAATTRDERVDILTALSDLLHRSDPTRAIELARRAVGLTTPRDAQRRARSLRALGVGLAAAADYRSAAEKLEQALELADGNSLLRADVLHSIGAIRTYLGEYRGAIELIDASLELRSSMEDRAGMAKGYNALGVVYMNVADYPRALESFHRAEHLYELVDDRAGLAATRNNIGGVYQALRSYERAAGYYLASLDLWRQLDDGFGQIHSLVNLGYICQTRSQPNAALVNFTNALDLSRRCGARQLECVALMKIGAIHMEAEEFDRALASLDMALAIAREIASLHDEVETSISIGQIELRCGREAEGVKRIESAIDHARRAGERQQLHAAHRILAEHFERRGELAHAFEHLKQQMAIGEEIVGQEQQRALTRLELRTELERAERERELLRLRSSQLEQEMEHRRAELTTLALTLAEKSTLLASLKKEMSGLMATAEPAARRAMRALVRRIEEGMEGKEEWKGFERRFESVHRDFLARLAARAPDLSPTELRVCALLKLDLTTKEIADTLATSTRTVEGHRLKIRRKLAIDPEQSLVTFLATVG